MPATPRTRYATREVLGLVGMGVALFWSAGRLDWRPAWAALAVMTVWTAGMALIVLRDNSALLAERLGRQQGDKRWDAAIVALSGLVTLARYILAGLDQRYDWTGGLPLAAQVIACVLCILGYNVLFLWATAANRFFSRIVRIQSERGHTAVTEGPYHIIRHPGYAGMLTSFMGCILILNTLYGLILYLLYAVLVIIRTSLEDRTLQAELPGYAEYAQHTRYRLLPGLW